jgi:hypothetical protein
MIETILEFESLSLAAYNPKATRASARLSFDSCSRFKARSTVPDFEFPRFECAQSLTGLKLQKDLGRVTSQTRDWRR